MTEKKTGMRIRTRILLSSFTLVALLVVVGIASIICINEVYSNGREIYVNNLRAVDFLKSINQNVKQIDQCVISMMSDLDKDYHQEYVKQIEQLQLENEELMEEYSQLDVDILEKRRYNQCQLSILTFDKHIETIVNYLEAGQVDMAITAYEQELMPAKATTYELIDAVVDISTKNAKLKNEDNQAIYKNMLWITSVIIVLAVIIAIIITLSISNYFMDKLEAIQRLAKRNSEYNISDDLIVFSNDEFGETMEALNESQFMMRDLMNKIIDESATLSDTGEEVSLAVRKSSQRIEDVNVTVLQSGDLADGMDKRVREILESRNLDKETAEKLRVILKQSYEARNGLEKVRTELSSIAIYLEQIGITSDYQNEVANSHRDQVQKFKI